MTHLQAYLFVLLDNINLLASLTLMLLILLFIGFLIVESERDDEDKVLIKRHFKWMAIMFLFTSLVSVFLPTQKQMAFIYIIPKIVNNESIQDTIKQLPELSNLGLEYLNDLLKGKRSNND